MSSINCVGTQHTVNMDNTRFDMVNDESMVLPAIDGTQVWQTAEFPSTSPAPHLISAQFEPNWTSNISNGISGFSENE